MIIVNVPNVFLFSFSKLFLFKFFTTTLPQLDVRASRPFKTFQKVQPGMVGLYECM